MILELQQLLDVAGLVPRNGGFRAGEAVTVLDEFTFVGLSVGFVSLPFSAALWKHHGLKVDLAGSKTSFFNDHSRAADIILTYPSDGILPGVVGSITHWISLDIIYTKTAHHLHGSCFLPL